MGSHRQARFALVLLLLVSCDPKKEPTPTATSSSAPPPAASSSTPMVASVGPEERAILAVTKRWNEALAKRDAEALRSLYDDKVRLYTTNTDRTGAVKAKTAAFASAKDYTQSIGPVEVDLRDRNKPSASFEKTWTSNGKTSKVLARLRFIKGPHDYRITEESDDPSDERRKKASDPQSCEAAIVQVVMSVPRAARLLNGPTNPAGGHASNGLRVDPHEDNPALVAVAVHENHDDHLATLAWFDVDTQSGIVRETMPADDEVVTADAAKVTKMKAACKK